MKKLIMLVLMLALLFSVACAPVSGELRDGQYTAEVALSGGSGRASVSSPAEVTLANGKMTARIIWSSPNYDLMLVDGEKYLLLNKDGNSTFEIPIATLDQEIAVSAETTAMSQPHMIDYTLRFDCATLRADDGGMIWIIAGAIVLVAVAAAVILRKRRKKV
jgi:LPXTG-motif cell wall-anchored protein